MSSNTQRPEGPPADEREEDELAPSELESVHGGSGQLLPAVQGVRVATTLNSGNEIAVETLTIAHEAIKP